MWLYESLNTRKTVFLGFVKHEDSIPAKDESPESKENALYSACMIDSKRSFLLIKRKEKLIYLLNLTLSFKGD